MNLNTDEYEQQLQSVEQSLKTVEDLEERTALNSLKANLEELIELTEQTNAAQLRNTEDEFSFKDELERFQREIALLDNVSVDATDTTKADIGQNLIELKSKLEEMVGEKCSAPHQHSWGAISYHNAIVCGIEEIANIDSEGELKARLRVLFTNPTHKEMMPCLFYLEGECRFDEKQCHYSHGELVDAEKLGPYTEPNFERLARNCVVLAKLPDRLWYRGHVICTNFVEQICRVRLDRNDENSRERDFPFEDLLPISHEDDVSSSSTDEYCEDDDRDYLEDMNDQKRENIIERSLFELNSTEPLGEWEKHTRGIGSKIMAKMGYVHGTGLGSDGSGIVVPVSAQILPQGCSLDRCMEIREAANGEKDFYSVEKKLRIQQKKQEGINAKAYERETRRTDVFSFINENILGGNTEMRKKIQKNTSLSNETMKSLNVASVRIADDIRRKEREILKLQKSIERNPTGSDISKRLHQQLQSKTQELNNLRKEENILTKEQTSRKIKDKLYVF